MQMAFYDGSAFPEEYRGDAFVAMRGSWNRRPRAGYEILRVDFKQGRPVGFEKFLEGFLVEKKEGGYGYLARLTGVAVGKDGSLFVADDSNGIVYRITHEATENTAAVPAQPPKTVAELPPSDIATSLVKPATDARIDVQAPFEHERPIPVAYVADGDNASPKLQWDGAPEATQSFVVIAEDPDARQPKPFVHWIVYDLPAGVTALREGLPTEPLLQDPKGVKQGTNSMGATGYFGPKPPVEDPPHAYHFQVFALDVARLGLDPGATRDEVIAAMQGHVLALGEIVGTYKRGEAVAAKD